MLPKIWIHIIYRVEFPRYFQTPMGGFQVWALALEDGRSEHVACVSRENKISLHDNVDVNIFLKQIKWPFSVHTRAHRGLSYHLIWVPWALWWELLDGLATLNFQGSARTIKILIPNELKIWFFALKFCDIKLCQICFC